jgi:hypothetical protein
MNVYTRNIFQMKLQIIAVAAVCLFSSCGGSDPKPQKTESEKVTELLTAGDDAWILPTSGGGVLVDGVDVTDDLFPGFTITFLEETFTTTGTSPVWLREDTWRFKDQTAKVMIRGQDDREISIEEISATQLKLTLEWAETTTVDGGRERSLKGKHEFILNRQ